MRTLVYTNPNGQSVTLSNSPPYLITSLTGLDLPQLNVQAQKAPYQDGQTFIDAPLDVRNIAVEGAVLERDMALVWKRRQLLLEALNPKLGPGQLVLYRDQQDVQTLEAIPDPGFSGYQQIGGTYANGRWTRSAASSDWISCVLRSLFPRGAGATATCQMPAIDALQIGLHDTNRDTPARNILYGIEATTGGAINVWEGLDTWSSVTTYAIGDVLGVFYDGRNIHYQKNGVDFRVKFVGSGLNLYYYLNIYTTAKYVNNVLFQVPAGDYFPDNRLQLTALPTGPLFKNKSGKDPFQMWALTFEAFDPYWYAYNSSTANSVFNTGNMIWPNLTFPRAKSIRNSGSFPATCYGDVPSPVTITVNGPSTNPKIMNLSTGEYLRVTKTLNTGDKLQIFTGFGKKSIMYTPSGGSPSLVMQFLDLGSTFWSLNPGSNNLAFTDDSGNTAQTCVVSWNDRYLGV